MGKSQFPVILVSFLLLVVTFGPSVGLPIPVLSMIYGLSPLLIIWMVISVLRDRSGSEKEFNDGHWYEDYDINQIGDRKGLGSEHAPHLEKDSFKDI